jgi:hypothetical protein
MVVAIIITHESALPPIWLTRATSDHPARDLLRCADARTRSPRDAEHELSTGTNNYRLAAVAREHQ